MFRIKIILNYPQNNHLVCHCSDGQRNNLNRYMKEKTQILFLIYFGHIFHLKTHKGKQGLFLMERIGILLQD